MNRVWLLVGVGVALFAALVFWLNTKRPEVLELRDNQISFVHMLLLLVLVASGFFVRWRAQSLGQWSRYALAWGALGLVLVIGYSYRGDISRIWSRTLASVMPGYAVQLEPDTVIVSAGEDRHYRVDATVDGVAVRFLVDTGATNIVLNRQDARRLGFSNDRLSFTQRTQTANGIGLGAPVRLREIRVGTIEIRGFTALVNKAPMSSSLLGIDFLERLSGYEVKDGLLILKR
jgi:aspartyl protease family protein